MVNAYPKSGRHQARGLVFMSWMSLSTISFTSSCNKPRMKRHASASLARKTAASCLPPRGETRLFVVTVPRALATMESLRKQSSAKTNTWQNKTPSFITLYQLHCVHIHFYMYAR